MKYWIWLSTLPYIGTVSARKIITVLKKSEKCILQFGRRVKKNRKFNLTAKKQYFNEPRIRKCKKNY